MKLKGMWKDYVEMCKMGTKWFKRYWLAYMLIVIFVYAVMFGFMFRDVISEYIKENVLSRFKKQKVDQGDEA